MKNIESVRILKSKIEHGGDVKPFLSVVINPWPDEIDVIQIGDDITAAVMAFNRK